MTMDRLPGALLPDLWFSIDPGENNVGFAEWSGTECLEARHTEPDVAVDYVMKIAKEGGLGLLVHERFALYPGAEQGRGQMGSEFLTSQMIGVLKFICRHTKVPVVSHLASHHKNLVKRAEFRPPVKPLRAWKSYGNGGHAKDAESLGLYHIHTQLNKGRGY